MRLNIIPSKHSIKLVNGMYQETMKGSIIINYTPEGEYDLISKEMVDNMVNNIDLSKLETTVSRSNFPAAPGDFDKKNDDYFIKETNKGIGGHLSLTINSKGLITSSKEKIPSTIWESVEHDRIDKESLPDTPEALGIKDAITLDGKGETIEGFTYDEVGTRADAPVTYKKADDYFKPLVEYKVGDIILMKETNDFLKHNSEFIELDSSRVKKSKYPELYKLIGDFFSNVISKYDATPWKNPSTKAETTKPVEVIEITHDDVVSNLGGFGCLVTKNKVFVLGGYRGDRRKPLKTAYMAEIKNGRIGKFTRIGDLPEARVFSLCLAFGGEVFLLGGTPTPDRKVGGVKIMKAPINDDGTIGVWSILDTVIPSEMSNPAWYITGKRLHLLGGVSHEGMEEVDGVLKSITKPNKFYIWCNVDINNNFGKWNYVKNDFLNATNSDIAKPDNRRTLYFKNSEYPKKPGNIAFSLISSVTDHMNISNGRIWSNYGPTGIECLRSVESTTGSSGVEFWGSGMVNFVTVDDFTKSPFKYPFGVLRYWYQNYNNVMSWKTERISFEESPLERHHFSNFLTTEGIYVIGGIYGDDLENYERTIEQPILLTSGVKALDDYTDMFSKVEADPDEFRLPYMEPYLAKGVTYRYYVKAR